ncbi:MAG TPA: TonB family protein [Opitutales bacterium]|nr:TonB family protein [Opitutales bacterium]
MGKNSTESNKAVLPEQKWGWTAYVAVGGAIFMAVGLFLMIPLTQLLDRNVEPDVVVRETMVVVPPPPEMPPPPPQEESEPVREQPEIFIPSSEPVSIDVQPLNVALAPGISDAVAIGVGVPEFQVEVAPVAEIEDLFTFEDLQEAPRLLNMPRIRFPRALLHRGVTEGKVVVEIDILPDGQARFRRIISSTESELEPVAREVVQQARFSRPIVDGRPQTVRGHFPILLSN